MSVKDRRKTPALGLRTLQPYVPLRFSPSESVSARDIPVRPAPFKRSFSCLKEKSFRPVIGRKLSLVFTTCYNILRHTHLSYASPYRGDLRQSLLCMYFRDCSSGVIFDNLLLIPGFHQSRLAVTFIRSLLSPLSLFPLKFNTELL